MTVLGVSKGIGDKSNTKERANSKNRESLKEKEDHFFVNKGVQRNL